VTLLTTEIHRLLDRDIVVFAADRRISRGATPAGERRKVFHYPRHRLGVGYFGLAEIPGQTSVQPMAEWLQDFFYTVCAGQSIRSIALQLTEALNATVPPACRSSEHSGMHLAGLTGDDRAEFWFIRNFDDKGNLFRGPYEAREDFHSRDALMLPINATAIYRNGDVRAHVVAWSEIDQSLGHLLGQEPFRRLNTTADYVDWVQFKMETIARFYERWCTESIIGLPVDCFAVER
jgi:hypothetical protein